MNTEDTGYVILFKPCNMFYTGFGWDAQLRGAKIYHSMKYVNDAIKNMGSKFRYENAYQNPEDFEVYEVSVKIENFVK